MVEVAPGVTVAEVVEEEGTKETDKAGGSPREIGNPEKLS